VAGDHGEPIAQFIQVGTYLMPNNLTANAHGNGYSDPKVKVPAIIESARTDGGAFNVREGDHSVDLAATYVIRPSLQPFATAWSRSIFLNLHDTIDTRQKDQTHTAEIALNDVWHLGPGSDLAAIEFLSHL
jgi:hypothetical protein